MAIEIADNPELSRFELRKDGQLAGLVDYGITGETISMLHAEVKPEFQGQGLAGALAKAALDDARARNLLVAPLCPFIAAYVRKHPDQYLQLVTPEFQKRLGAGARS